MMRTGYKTLGLWGVAALFLLSGCTSDGDGPEPVDNIIEFDVPSVVLGEPEELSRAQRLDVLPAGEVFGVSGYCVPLSGGEDLKPDYNAAGAYWTAKNRNSIADVMWNQPIKFDGTKCVYRDAEGTTYYHPAHWYISAGSTHADPADFRYTFIAWHPYGGDYFTPSEKGAVGTPQIGFTMPFNPGDNGELDPTKVKDAMVAQTVDRLRNVDNVGTVPLRFRHILCGLRFQINNFNTSQEVIVRSLALSGSFYRSATISFAGTSPVVVVKGDETIGGGDEGEGAEEPEIDDTPGIDEDDMYSGTFRFLSEDDSSDDVTVVPNSGIIAGATPGSDGHSDGVAVLLLPHFEGETDRSYLGRSKRIHIKYTFEGKEGDKTIDFTLNRRPVAGTLYTVNLNFVGNQLMVTFTDDANNSWSWDEVETGDNTIK
ncbi:MAG: fimbrillin family protein [Bacteroides sp.]|nr:fimbrillin family protein [Bacteroides sp.]